MSETLETRVAVLEQLAKNTLEALLEIKASQKALEFGFRNEIGSIRTELNGTVRAEIGNVRTELNGAVRAEIGRVRGEFGGIRAEMAEICRASRSDFHWLLGTMLAMGAALLGTMTKGFHWL